MANVALSAYQVYRTMPWTSDSDECEAGCGVTMSEVRYVEGDLGHYCSSACRDDAETDTEPSQREDFHSDG